MALAAHEEGCAFGSPLSISGALRAGFWCYASEHSFLEAKPARAGSKQSRLTPWSLSPLSPLCPLLSIHEWGSTPPHFFSTKALPVPQPVEKLNLAIDKHWPNYPGCQGSDAVKYSCMCFQQSLWVGQNISRTERHQGILFTDNEDKGQTYIL